MPIFSRFLEAVHRHPRWGCAGLIAYAAVATFPHENVQWLVNEIAIRITHAKLYRVSAEITAVEAVALTGIVVWRLRAHAARITMASFWIVTLALILFTWHTFTANNVELVHYPQYIPEGILLMALTLSPAESLAWIVIFGGLDEAFQYAVLSWWRPVPYDFNDVYMDLLGGAVGVLVAMAFLDCGRRGRAAVEAAGDRGASGGGGERHSAMGVGTHVAVRGQSGHASLVCPEPVSRAGILVSGSGQWAE